VEAAVDLACPGIDPKAKLAKDASAGAVLVLSVASALIGLAVFINAALRLLGAGGC
jgi:diacylglycerol kinase